MTFNDSSVVKDEFKKERVVTTGQAEIDKRLGGGIPFGSLVLVEGQSAAGKSVLVQQMMWSSLKNEQKIVLFTSENTLRSIDKQMESLGLGIMDYILLGWLKVFPVKSITTKQFGTLGVIIDGISENPSHSIVIIDSITSVIAHSQMEDIIRYFELCKDLCDNGRTIINVAHTYAFDEQLLIRIGSVCDARLRLRIEEVGEKLVKVLEVSKIRGANKNTGNIVSFDVEPGTGMRVMPMGRAKT